jgi:multidrug transporter EmrE-like cation transporter
MMTTYALLAGAVLCGVMSQFLLKAGSDAPDFFQQLLRIPTIAGLAGYGIAAILYMLALRKLPVSIAYPSVSFSYVLVAILAHLIFKEPLGWQQWAGIVLVIAGVVLLSQGVEHA